MSSAQVTQNSPVTIDLKKINTSYKKSLSKKLALTMTVVVFIVSTVSTYGITRYLNSNQKDSSLTTSANSNLPPQEDATLTANNSKDEINKDINPFNGMPLSEEEYSKLQNKPLAVMMDNSTPAQGVQENINRADIVYEAITEWGITRFMGIFYSDQSNFRVMPVRSVRMAFLDNLMEYNDILLYHVGGAFTPERPEINAVQKVFDDKVKSIYYYKHNHTPVFNELYDQACFDKGIPGYSCKYHYTSTLYKKATEVGYQDDKWESDGKYDWQWKFDAKKAKSSDIIADNIQYKFTTISKGYNAEWQYDPTTNRYLRKTGGKKHMDNASKEQVWTNTLVVQKVKFDLNLDDKNRSYGHTIGEGDAYVFMDGKAYEVTWKKDCDTCRNRYYYKDSGEEFVFKPGRMWISVTRDVEPVTYKDTKAPVMSPSPRVKKNS